jgi:fused signal recognition particle receptor
MNSPAERITMFGKKEKPEVREGFIKRLRSRINRGNNWLTYDLSNLVPGGTIDENVLEDLESLLILGDVGVETTELIIEDLRQSLLRNELKDIEALRAGLERSLLKILNPVEKPLTVTRLDGPFVIFMVGVNGAGKTTTIGKLAHHLQNSGYSVMLAAGDTFRAAAVEQLQAWGERIDVAVVAQQSGADPAAVIFDAWQAAKARNIDVLLADTAGRLQNQSGLMDELVKMKRVVGRQDDTAPHEIMLVLDATQGQNALIQAEKFHAALGITGIAVTKLDGSAKGGILFAIASRLQLPVRFIGVGEAVEDMQTFCAAEFVSALLSSGDEDQ